MDTRFSVVGLGKLGASMAAAIASKGFPVIGVDVDPRVVAALNAGQAPVQETGLDELVAACRSRLHATMSHHEAVMNSDVSFVVVPTPSDERGAFSTQYVAWAFREIGRALRNKDRYHLVVLTSTVLPGSTRYALLPILERESSKNCGYDFGLCYSPEFIALGSVIWDFLNPDFVLIGEYDRRSGDTLEMCYQNIISNGAPYRRMSIENAELTKIAVNTFVTMKITFANLLADLCERLPGGDVDVVTEAVGTDSRIGHKYLKGALGYGGPCFPRDNVALSFLARTLGVHAELLEVVDRTNRLIPERITEIIRPFLRSNTTVAVLGLAYKPFSHVIEESQGINLALMIARLGVRVVAYDPLATDTARQELKGHAIVLDSPLDCIEQADVVIIATPDPEFDRLVADDFSHRQVVIVDCWRILENKLAGHTQVKYIPIGRSRDDRQNQERLARLWNP